MYIAHKGEAGVQSLKSHLTDVAKLAEDFASAFGAGRHAYRTGLLHDIGKYSPAGQKRMYDPEHTAKVDHASAGTKEAYHLRDLCAAFSIAGHHGGLMNAGAKGSVSDGTLMGRCGKCLDGDLDYSAFRTEIDISTEKLNDIVPKWLNLRDGFSTQFYTRMLFSCLVDADYLDTETFMSQNAIDRGTNAELPNLLEKLNRHVEPWLSNPSNELNRRRCEILRQCIENGRQDQGLFSLTVPTGGGKTVSSLAFALTHAVCNHQKRIIYVIPYTSIIEQTAGVFSKILGEGNVLEHHSGTDLENDDDLSTRKKLMTENWDAPVVVTTAVQFFESLYAAKTSKCRKLHNISDSVIIFDEAQMLPLYYLRPCVAAIAELVRNYHSTAVLCTATQPSLSGLFAEFAPELEIRELVHSEVGETEVFHRVKFDLQGQMTESELAESLGSVGQVLCIVNTRLEARRIFDLLPQEGRYHLSTRMTAGHRSRILREIHTRLKNGETCRVVSTSLIEAGVDIDFPEVWREKAGLDSVLQAAGRCNREGKRDPNDCIVHIFSLEGKIPRRMWQNVSATDIALDCCDTPDSSEAIRVYFDQLLRLIGDNTDQKEIMQLCRDLEFKTVAEKFHLIDDNTFSVYIPDADNQELLDSLRGGYYTKKELRKLGRSIVNVFSYELDALRNAGKIEETKDGFHILCDASAYSAEVGLLMDSQMGSALWV